MLLPLGAKSLSQTHSALHVIVPREQFYRPSIVFSTVQPNLVILCTNLQESETLFPEEGLFPGHPPCSGTFSQARITPVLLLPQVEASGPLLLLLDLEDSKALTEEAVPLLSVCNRLQVLNELVRKGLI